MDFKTKYCIGQMVYFINHWGINFGEIRRLNINVISLRAAGPEIKNTYWVGGFFHDESNLFPNVEALIAHLSTTPQTNTDAPINEDEPF